MRDRCECDGLAALYYTALVFHAILEHLCVCMISFGTRERLLGLGYGPPGSVRSDYRDRFPLVSFHIFIHSDAKPMATALMLNDQR